MPYFVKGFLKIPARIKAYRIRFIEMINSNDGTALFAGINNWVDGPQYLEPEELFGFHNDYLNALSEIIIKNKGTFVDFSGDEIVAVFGAPIFYEEHSFAACETLLQIRKITSEIFSLYPNISEVFSLKCGINSGWILSGFLGPECHRKFSIIGDNVNLALRCKESTNFYKHGM